MRTAGQWAASEIHRAGVWAGERLVCALGPEPEDELLALHAAAHVSTNHERQPAEHASLRYVGPVGQEVAYSGGERLIECHGRLLPQRSRQAEVREDAGVGETGDGRHAAVSEREDHEAVGVRDRRMGIA